MACYRQLTVSMFKEKRESDARISNIAHSFFLVWKASSAIYPTLFTARTSHCLARVCTLNPAEDTVTRD